MTFHETRLSGVLEVHIEPKADERGFFARTWCQREFEAHGLDANLAQCNISFNPRRGTLRGIHYQAAPEAESKLVRCTRGAVYDVVVDLRSNSPTYRDWIGVVLTVQMRNMVFVPQGCGHGFLTLEDDAEVFYQMSQFYSAEAARGVRWDDPAFQISWPGEPAVISERDRTYPDFD